MITANREPETQNERVAAWLNDADVIQWLRARAALAALPGLLLSIDSGEGRMCCSAILKGKYEYGNTLEEAITKTRLSQPSPQMMRREAQKLLELAAETESKAAREDEQRTEEKKHQPKVSFHD